MLLRCESLEPPMSQLGQSRQTNTPDEFAACPLYLQLRLYRWTATNRREVPLGDIIRLPGWSHRMYFSGNTHAREGYP